MDLCITIQDRHVTIDAPIKDPKVKKQIIDATNAYLGALYSLFTVPSDINVSMIFSIQPINCCICLDDCSTPVEITCACTEKYYHKACLMKWFHRKKECPTCRKRLTGRGYKFAKITNPYNTKQSKRPGTKRVNPSSEFIYQCPGGTHPKKSSFKYLFSALKHAKEKHQVDIGFMTRSGEKTWFCRHGDCTGSGYDFNSEQLWQHLQNVHHLDVITSK